MSDPDAPDPLPRRIGIVGAIALAFNGAVAASVFALPATLAADFGNFSPLLFPIVGLAALLIIVPFTWSAAAFPESGGPAAYGRVSLLKQSIISVTVRADVVQPVGGIDPALSIFPVRHEDAHGWFHAVLQPPAL